MLAQSRNGSFKYGVSGHPLTQESYSENIDLQINIIKELNSKFYRFDVPTDSNGSVHNKELYNLIIKKLKKNNIKLLPVLVFNASVYNQKSSQKAYQNGYNYGRNFAKNYKNTFDYYEVGNEEDNNLILPGRHGTNIADFDTVKASTIMSYFKGVCNGIRKEDLYAKIIINHAWVHWGFLELLNKTEVKYDIIGCHWYSEMLDLQDANGDFGNVINDIYKRFYKPIWITEINIRNGSSFNLAKKDKDWFLRNLKFIRYNKKIGAVFFYELLDEPAFANKQSPYYNLGEVSYGLGAWRNKYSHVTNKPIFNAYKLFIKQNP
ncbi:hypothetical protein GCM10028809_10320 [Spirosoma gilvum]